MSAVEAYGQRDREALIEQHRRSNGQFGSYDRAEPDGYDGLMGTYPEVSIERGSFQYPEPTGFSGEVDDYLDFFQNVPIPEDLVRRADDAYAKAYSEAVTAAGEKASEATMNDPALASHASALGKGELGEFLRPHLEKAIREAREAEAAKWSPGPRISPFDVRQVLRAGQICKGRGVLTDPEKQRQVLDTVHTWTSGKQETYGEIWRRFRVGEWIRNVI
ncbi:MAG: hypothetical protein ACTH0V_00175 [Microbacteriaceae bacterium]